MNQSNHLMTASKDSTAQMFSHPGDELEGYLSRSAGVPIRWVSVDKKGERVAICGE
jgi:chromosome transmission fidelity protein 4